MESYKSLSAVPLEPHICLVPTFLTNDSQGFSSSLIAPKSLPDLGTFGLSDVTKALRANSMPIKSNCTCPGILAADDDLFQHAYYKCLFYTKNKPEDHCLQTCFSGEELIESLNKVMECGCGTMKLVITDYQMGEKNLNGVETSVKARKGGYKGPLFLRTSETKDFLKENHEDFELLLKENVINVLVNKSDVSFGQKFIQKVVT